MSAHVLINLFNELRISHTLQSSPSNVPLFPNEFSKLDNTIYHMTLKLLLNLVFIAFLLENA